MERYKVVKVSVDHGFIDHVSVVDVFKTRAEALDAWELEGSYEPRHTEPGALYSHQHMLLVEREGSHYTLEGEAVPEIPVTP